MDGMPLSFPFGCRSGSSYGAAFMNALGRRRRCSLQRAFLGLWRLCNAGSESVSGFDRFFAAAVVVVFFAAGGEATGSIGRCGGRGVGSERRLHGL